MRKKERERETDTKRGKGKGGGGGWSDGKERENRRMLEDEKKRITRLASIDVERTCQTHGRGKLIEFINFKVLITRMFELGP